MKSYLTLICVLFLCAISAGTAYGQTAAAPAPEQKPLTIVAAIDSVSSKSLLFFAQSLMGIRYRPASSDPSRGFDCSGFVSYVFKRFNFDVPRSSSDFINVGKKILLGDARPGDIILFTGTKSHHPHSIGHIGIVYANAADGLQFIHSTSGKEHGVTISNFDATYQRRFVQVIRLLKKNDL